MSLTDDLKTLWTHRGFDGLTMVGDQYDGGCGPSNSSLSLSLLQMPCLSQVFYFDNSETMHFI